MVIVEEVEQFDAWLKSKGINVLKCNECAFQGPLNQWHAMDIAGLISRGVAYDNDKTGRFMDREGKTMGAPRPIITISCPNCTGMKMFNLENITIMQDALKRSYHGEDY